MLHSRLHGKLNVLKPVNQFFYMLCEKKKTSQPTEISLNSIPQFYTIDYKIVELT